MPKPFFHVTAELVMSVVDAIVAFSSATEEQLRDFCDISEGQAKDALGLAVDLGLIKHCSADNSYSPIKPLAIFASSGSDIQKSSMLRVLLESYQPFLCFRDRLKATNSADTAATQVKQLLGLDAHREHIKATLISLGTYTNAMKALGGGQYELHTKEMEMDINHLSDACSDLSSAELFIREHIGPHNDKVDREKVIIPLASSILKAISNENRECISEAGNAIESFLSNLAARMSVNLSGASGIIQKLSKFGGSNDKLPKKIIESAKYLGQIRNAASHGTDSDINSQWTISDLTAKNYPMVGCSFIHAVLDYEKNGKYSI